MTGRPIAAEARDCTIGMNQSQFQNATSAISSRSGTPIQTKRREVRTLRMASEKLIAGICSTRSE